LFTGGQAGFGAVRSHDGSGLSQSVVGSRLAAII